MFKETRKEFCNCSMPRNISILKIQQWKIESGKTADYIRFRMSIGQSKRELLITLTQLISKQLLSEPLTWSSIYPESPAVMCFEWKPTGTSASECSVYQRLKHQVTGFIGVFSQFQAISTKAFHAPASKKLPPLSRGRNEKLTESSLN